MKNKSLTIHVIEYILKCRDDEFGDLSVKKISSVFNVSKSFLARKFKQDTSFTLSGFIYRERMLRAATMLVKYPDITIKKLSRKVGFYDYNYFIHIFKEHYGVSPTRFRLCKLQSDSPIGFNEKPQPTFSSEKVIEYVLSRDLGQLKDLTDEHIAHKLRMECDYLMKRFEGEQKMSLSDFIARAKLNRAFLILEKDRSITIDELSVLLGFHSTDEFEKDFEGYFAIEPGKYREFVAQAVDNSNGNLEADH